jgi:hypothetical protein
MTLISNESNEIGEKLNERLDGWFIEIESDSVGRAYNRNPHEDPPKEEVVSVEIRTDRTDDFEITSSAFNEMRGMGDLVHSDRKSTLEDALDKAEEFATELKNDRL